MNGLKQVSDLFERKFMSKEMWFKVHERLETELGRTPTENEMQDAYQDHLADQIDHARDLAKDKWIFKDEISKAIKTGDIPE